MAPIDSAEVTASAWELLDPGARAGLLRAVRKLLPRLRANDGPVLAAGSQVGRVARALLLGDRRLRVVALEPCQAAWAGALAALSELPEAFGRVTVRPEDFFTASLPPRLGGAVLLGALQRFDPGERAAVFAELADRLPVGGVALLDLPARERPRREPARVTTVATVGDLSYRTITEGWPLDTELMRWRISYLTLEGERIIAEQTHELSSHHPSPNVIEAEAAQAGLRLDELAQPFRLLTRIGSAG